MGIGCRLAGLEFRHARRLKLSGDFLPAHGDTLHVPGHKFRAECAVANGNVFCTAQQVQQPRCDRQRNEQP